MSHAQKCIPLFTHGALFVIEQHKVLDGLTPDLMRNFFAQRGELVEARRHCGREDTEDGRCHWMFA
jgi:hypothetical protein